MDSAIEHWVKPINFSQRPPRPHTPRILDHGFRADETASPLRRKTRQSTFDFTTSHRDPVNQWKPEQRVILVWLVLAFQAQWSVITSIFNGYFKNDLPTPKGLTRGALVSMYNHLRLRSDEQIALQELDSPVSLTHTTLSRRISRARLDQLVLDEGIDPISHILADLPVHLITGYARKSLSRKRKALERDDTPLDLPPEAPKGKTNISPSFKPPASMKESARMRVDAKRTTNGHLDSDYDSDRTDFQPYAPKKRCPGLVPKTPSNRNARISENSLLTPPSSKQKQRSSDLGYKRLPRIAFRAFSDASMGINGDSIRGFQAGAFINMDNHNIPPAPSPINEVYLSEAARHVAKNHTGPTKFISLSRNLLRCLHRAIKAGPDSWIAIIDLQHADRHGAVQAAAALRIKVDCVYKPWGEYLVWGFIPPSAIVSVVSLNDLLAAMPTIPGDNDPFGLKLIRGAEYLREARAPIYDDPLPMSFQSGRSCGALMKATSIPSSIDMLDAAVYSIISDWKFSGNETWKTWKENVAFREGVEYGFFGEQRGQLLILDQEDDMGPIGITEEFDKLPSRGRHTGRSRDFNHEDEPRAISDEGDLQRDDDFGRELTIDFNTDLNGGAFVDDFITDLQEAVEASSNGGDTSRESSGGLEDCGDIDRLCSREQSLERPGQLNPDPALTFGEDSSGIGRPDTRDDRAYQDTTDKDSNVNRILGINIAQDISKNSNTNRAVGFMIAQGILKNASDKKKRRDSYQRYARMYSWTG